MLKQLEVLIAAMNQRDFSLVSRMNLHCDAIIANQAGKNETLQKRFPFGLVRMISTDSVGVGHNRNTALQAAEAEYILFADEDITYQDAAPEAVAGAFREMPEADILIFSMDYTRAGQLIERRHLKRRRLHLYNSLRFGAVSIAARRESLVKAGIRFNENFGGGCRFSSGEDSLFLRDCYRSGLRVYSHEYVLGRCSRDSSSWFCGYNEKYFFDKGVLMGCLFPTWKYLMTLYFAVRFKRATDISVGRRIQLMYQGLSFSKEAL